MPTIKDVAERAGVSPSTVSRVIADSPKISEATKRRVRQAMRELHYHPNAIARSLVRQSPRSIGLVLSRSPEAALLNPFFPEVIRGISSVARSARYNLVLTTSSTPEEERSECLTLLRERRVDGVILLASRWNDPLVETLAADGHPFVVVGRLPGSESPCWVNNDNVKAAKEATAHLIGLGHKRIAFLGGPGELVVSHDRLEGYREALKEGGIPFDERLVRETHFSVEEGGAAALDLLRLAPDVTAFVCVDDLLALGVLRAAAQAGRRVPEDLSVVGFNDNPFCAYITPSLTSVRVPIFEMGVEAARLLIDWLAGKRPSGGTLLPAQLIVRDSTGPLGTRRGGGAGRPKGPTTGLPTAIDNAIPKEEESE